MQKVFVELEIFSLKHQLLEDGTKVASELDEVVLFEIWHFRQFWEFGVKFTAHATSEERWWEEIGITEEKENKTRQ